MSGALHELQSLIRSRGPSALWQAGEIVEISIFGGAVRNDWRPVWAKQREIQGAFQSRSFQGNYEEKQRLWEKFNELRDEASCAFKSEKDNLHSLSSIYYDRIMRDLKYLDYDPKDFMDDILGVSADDIKRLGAKAKEAAQDFSENAYRMTKEHKGEVYLRLKEVRASHDLFFKARSEAWQRTQGERATKRAAFIERVEFNIGANEEKLAKAELALERCKKNIEGNYEKLSEPHSESYGERVRGWIEEGEERLNGIKESMDRIRGWIDEDKKKI